MKKSHNKYQYQEDLIKGLKKGQLHVFGMGRGTGKSKYAKIAHNKYMLDILTDRLKARQLWGDWEVFFTLMPKRCELTGKWLVGRVCRRTRIRYVPWNDINGKKVERQYASAKEIFIRKLKDGQ